MTQRIFVRSRWQIAPDSPEATGERSTETECLLEFGEMKWQELLEEMDENGGAMLPSVRLNIDRQRIRQENILWDIERQIAVVGEESENPVISRIAELRAQGIHAVPYLTWDLADDSFRSRTNYRVCTKLPDGSLEEDEVPVDRELL